MCLSTDHIGICGSPLVLYVYIRWTANSSALCTHILHFIYYALVVSFLLIVSAAAVHTTTVAVRVVVVVVVLNTRPFFCRVRATDAYNVYNIKYILYTHTHITHSRRVTRIYIYEYYRMVTTYVHTLSTKLTHAHNIIEHAIPRPGLILQDYRLFSTTGVEFSASLMSPSVTKWANRCSIDWGAILQCPGCPAAVTPFQIIVNFEEYTTCGKVEYSDVT